MSALIFDVDWEPADGVTHPALARTWARLEVLVNEDSITRLYDRRDRSTRAGTYGPIFPLCEWLVQNFWFLISESSPQRPPREWVRRHSFIAARQGGSLPDLRLFRDEGVVVAEWHATRARHLPVEFTAFGRAELDPVHVRTSLINLVDSSLEQLRSLDHPDVQALRVDWQAVLSSLDNDAVLCERAARLGLDAFDETEVPDSLVRTLTEGMEELPETTRTDLLDAGSASSQLESTLRFVSGMVAQEQPAIVGGKTNVQLLTDRQAPAYEQGYQTARGLRQQLGQAVQGHVDMDRLIQTLGWKRLQRPVNWPAMDLAVKAIAGIDPQGEPALISPARPSYAAQSRFLVARGLYALVSGATNPGPRLLTNGGTRFQAASRAFAAELLAPIEALRARIGHSVDEDRIEELANEFGVSTTVIARQLENDDAGRHMDAMRD